MPSGSGGFQSRTPGGTASTFSLSAAFQLVRSSWSVGSDVYSDEERSDRARTRTRQKPYKPRKTSTEQSIYNCSDPRKVLTDVGSTESRTLRNGPEAQLQREPANRRQGNLSFTLHSCGAHMPLRDSAFGLGLQDPGPRRAR